MIPNIFIQNWSNHVKWQTPTQIEQDLIISRALVDLYNDPHIKDALVFRGGTESLGDNMTTIIETERLILRT